MNAESRKTLTGILVIEPKSAKAQQGDSDWHRFMARMAPPARVRMPAEWKQLHAAFLTQHLNGGG